MPKASGRQRPAETSLGFIERAGRAIERQSRRKTARAVTDQQQTVRESDQSRSYVAQCTFVAMDPSSLIAAFCASAARWRGDQGGADGEQDLVRRVGQGVAEGHGCELDGQAQEGEGQAGRQKVGLG